jgi:diacylglycerol kinase family enzyme
MDGAPPLPTRLWLIVNPASGSYDAAIGDRLGIAAQQFGAEITRTIAFPAEPLPDAATLDAAEVAMLVVYTGDGTINAATAAVAGWRGVMLVLPGGTMNLLSRHLHRGTDPVEILADALSLGAIARPVTMVEGVGGDVAINGLVGLFAGPTTAWGDVRETLRRYDFAGLVEAVPRAIGETFNGSPVRLAGSAEEYPAIYIEPVGGKLRLLGFTADDAAALFEHGFAWLNGDFRDGPHDMLGEASEITIESAGEIGLLVDGERGHSHSPLTLRAAHSPVRFVVTRPDAAEVRHP